MDDKFLSGGGYTGTQWSAHSDPYSIIPFEKSAVSRISIMTGISELLSYSQVPNKRV